MCCICARPTLFLWMPISSQATVQEEAKKRQHPRLPEGLGLVASPVTLQRDSAFSWTLLLRAMLTMLTMVTMPTMPTIPTMPTMPTMPWKVSRCKHVTSLNLTVLHFSDLVCIVVILESIPRISKMFLLMPRTSQKGLLDMMSSQHKNKKSTI